MRLSVVPGKVGREALLALSQKDHAARGGSCPAKTCLPLLTEAKILTTLPIIKP